MTRKVALDEIKEVVAGTVVYVQDGNIYPSWKHGYRKRGRAAAVRKRAKSLFDILEAFWNFREDILSAEREKRTWQELSEIRNRQLQEKSIGEAYYSLSLRQAGRREKIKLLRQVWSKQSYRLARLKRKA